MASKKFSLFPIFVTVFIDLLGVGIVIPVLAPLLIDLKHGIFPIYYSLGERAVVLGLLLSSYSIAQFFSAPLLGALSDRHGRKKVLLISIFGTFIGYLLFGFGVVTKNLQLLFASRILDGFTGGNISTAMSAIADSSDKDSKTKNFGLVGMAFGLGFIIGPYIGGKLSDPSIVSFFDFATPFWVAAFLCLLNILLVAWRFQETLKTKIMTKINLFIGFQNIHKAFQLSNLRVILFVAFLQTFGFTFFTQFFQVFLIKRFAYGQSQIGDLFGYIGLWIAFTQGILTRVISYKYKPKQVLSCSILLLAISLPSLLLPNKHHLLFIIAPLIAIFQGLTLPNITTLISDLGSSESQGEILGINQSIQSLAFALPPIIAGVAVSVNLRLPILLAGLTTFVAWLIFVLYFKEKKEVFVEV